jgi:ketosteroid isomerase-like protein
MHTPTDIVHLYWHLMESNDFESVRTVLAESFVLEWPQSGERIRGGANFARMNREYPAKGPWRFSINRLFGSGEQVVSDVNVTDGAMQARALSFFEVSEGKITRIVEFWPEPYPAPKDRAHLVERF